MEEKIKIVSNGICIDIDKLKDIIINKWQSGYLYQEEYKSGYRGKRLYQFILNELDDYVDGLMHETEKEAQKKMGRPNARLDWFDKYYPKSDVRSIGFEVVDKLSVGISAPPEKLMIEDIPAILEFLDTPPDKALEAWDTWEKYWANLDYDARRKKLEETY